MLSSLSPSSLPPVPPLSPSSLSLLSVHNVGLFPTARSGRGVSGGGGGKGGRQRRKGLMEDGREEEEEEEREEEEEPAMPNCDQGWRESAGRCGGEQGFFRKTPCHHQSFITCVLCPPRAQGDVVKSRKRAVVQFTPVQFGLDFGPLPSIWV